MQRNNLNHLFCVDTVYGASVKKKDYKLSETTVRRAIALLFDEVSSEQEKELIKIAKSDFNNHGSVVWRKQERKDQFNEFLERNSLDTGLKEIIILENGETLQYTDDFRYYPETVD